MKYQTDANGDPILTRSSKVPNIQQHDASKLPILGLPLVNYSNVHGDGPKGKAKADHLW